MKSLIISMTLMTSLCFAKSYNCRTYDLSDSQASEPTASFQMEVNLEDNQAMIAFGEDVEAADAKTTNIGFIVGSGNGPDRYEFHVITDKKVNFVKEYIDAMSEEYGIEGEDKELFAEKVTSRYGDKKINGSMLVLANISAFLSCEQF